MNEGMNGDGGREVSRLNYSLNKKISSCFLTADLFSIRYYSSRGVWTNPLL